MARNVGPRWRRARPPSWRANDGREARSGQPIQASRPVREERRGLIAGQAASDAEGRTRALEVAARGMPRPRLPKHRVPSTGRKQTEAVGHSTRCANAPAVLAGENEKG